MSGGNSGYDFRSHKPVTDVNSIMKQSVLTPELFTSRKLPESSKRFSKKEKKKHLELPPEIKNDLKLLRMRSALDTKRFYKRSSLKALPKDVQIGKVIDSPADFYSSRLTKKQRKPTLVDELLANQQFKREAKKRYVSIVTNNKKRFKKDYKRLEKIKRMNEKRKKHKK